MQIALPVFKYFSYFGKKPSQSTPRHSAAILVPVPITYAWSTSLRTLLPLRWPVFYALWHFRPPVPWTLRFLCHPYPHPGPLSGLDWLVELVLQCQAPVWCIPQWMHWAVEPETSGSNTDEEKYWWGKILMRGMLGSDHPFCTGQSPVCSDGESSHNLDNLFRLCCFWHMYPHTQPFWLLVHSHKHIDPVLSVLKGNNLGLLLQSQCVLDSFPRLLWDVMDTKDLF